MLQPMLIISNFTIAALDIVVIVTCMFYFMRKQERNIYRKNKYYVLGAVLAGVGIMAVTATGNNLIATLGFLLVTVVIGRTLFHNGRMHVFYHLLFGVLFLCVQIVVINLVTMAVVAFDLSLARYGILYSDVMMLTKQMAELVFTRAAAEFFRKRRFGAVRWKRFLSYLALPFLSILFLVSLVSYAVILPTTETLFVVSLNIVLLVAMNLYVTYIFERMEQSKELEREISLYEQQASMQYRYYEELEEKYQDSRKNIHDMRNHLLMLQELCRQEQAMSYMEDLHALLNELGQKYYSPNRVLNILLNDKEKLAAAAGIETDFSVREEDFGFVRDIDLTTLLANLLDNAIEAARNSERKKIELRIDRFHRLAAIRLENDADEAPKLERGTYISRKKGGGGIGLLNAARVVERYHGIMTTKYENRRFLVSVTFPLEKEE